MSARKPADERHTEPFVVRVTPAMNNTIRAEAKRLGISVNELLNRFVTLGLASLSQPPPDPTSRE